MPIGKLEVWSEPRDHRRYRDLWIYESLSGEHQSVASLVFTPVDPGVFDIPPTVKRDGTEYLQAILDHAWSIGLRPVGFNDVPLQVEALRAHLHDMRALVFGRTPLILPEGLDHGNSA